MALREVAKLGAASLPLFDVRKGTEELNDLAEPVLGVAKQRIPCLSPSTFFFPPNVAINLCQADSNRGFRLLLCSLGV